MHDEDYFEAGTFVPDVLRQRCEMLVELAPITSVCTDKRVKDLLLRAMEALVWSIEPPRGQLFEIPKVKRD